METEIVACIVREACGPADNRRDIRSASTADSQKHRGQQLLRRRKQLNPFLAPTTPYHLTNVYARRVVIPSTSPHKLDTVTQRVLSAKDHRVKQLESQLGETRAKLSELVAENRLYRSLNKRNSAALSRFQDVEAELPSLLSWHSSEVKSLRERYQKLSIQHREQTRELRGRDLAIQTMREQIVNLNKLVQERGLRERQELTEKLEEARESRLELEEQHKTLARQLVLEQKSHKQQLVREHKRHRETQTELNKAREQITSLEVRLKSKEKFITDHLTRKEFHQSGRSFANFTTSASNLKKQQVPPKILSKQVAMRSISTAASTLDTRQPSEMSNAQEEEEEESESELVFSPNVAPSEESLRHNFSSSSNESSENEDVSQIYHPATIPTLTLHTTPSTPWAVDSRTFSIRSAELPRPIHPSLAAVSQQETYTTCVVASRNKTDEDQENEEIVEGTAEGVPPQETCSTTKENSTSQEEDNVQENGDSIVYSSEVSHESEGILSDKSRKSQTTTPVDQKTETPESNPLTLSETCLDPKVGSDSSSPDVSSEHNSYSKEALLAALRAIDTQQVSEPPPPSIEALPKPRSAESLKSNHISSNSKAELMQELFGTENSEAGARTLASEPSTSSIS